MKSTAYIKYSVDVQGIKFDFLKIELNDPQIDSLTLTMADEKRINFSFMVSDPVSLDQACRSTEEAAEKVLDVFSYYYEIKVGKLSLDDNYLESVDENGNQNTTTLIQLGVRIGIAVSSITHVNNLDNSLINLVNLPAINQKLISCRQFRFAMQTEDAVSRYMFFYSILLQLYNDQQKEVDNFICTQKPTVKRFQSPKFPGVMETIYTKLRNEIAHVRQNVTLEATSKDIKSEVNCLQSLTKRAIELLV